MALLLVTVTLTVFDVPTSEGNLSTLAEPKSAEEKSEFWIAPDHSMISQEVNAELIEYGYELIKNTASYLGPKGSVMAISNGMNCQNCHLDAGTKVWGNNYSAVASTYPKFRERSGAYETIPKRINDCFERSLNGKALDTNSREMNAMVSYIKWLGKDVQKNEVPNGSGIIQVPFLDRAASPEKGEVVYQAKCESCHQKDGAGVFNADNKTYAFPPLWGEHSYNSAAGLYRLSRFAGYVKANMPLGASHDAPILSDEEAWDLAAFVNSKPRPSKDISKDWPNISGKPIDHPFGPFADGFSEAQHKYGPFKPIKEKRQALKNKKKA
ncbi:MAG: c-type cytochrome [Bacteroidia bacterium]|nr:c-type cytochrome [Bacteroidia bacterium]